MHVTHNFEKVNVLKLEEEEVKGDVGPPLESSSESSAGSDSSSEGGESEQEEEKMPGPQSEPQTVNTQKTDRDALRNILLNTLYYYNCKEKVDATLSKLKGGEDADKKKKDDKKNSSPEKKKGKKPEPEELDADSIGSENSVAKELTR